MDKRVGFIGLGIMGMPMARNLLKKGFEVMAYNRTRSKAEDLAREGAEVASSCQEVAQGCPVVVTIVTDSPDVESVVLGEQGVMHGVGPGSVVIDMSTISPKVARHIAARLEEKGARLLDAPVSGGQWGAIEGTLSVMVGGEAQVLERCRPVLEAMGRHIVHVGPNGMGQTAKLVNQILVAGTLNAVCEALVFAAKAGADLEATMAAVKGGAAGSWQLENLGARILKGDFDPGFMVDLQQKDLRLVLEAAAEMDLPLPATSLVQQMYRSVQAAGGGRLGTQALVQVHERLSGVEARSRS